MRRARVAGRARWAVLAVAALCCLGGECGGGGGKGGDRSVERAPGIDARCAGTGTSPFPPGFDFVPGGQGRLLALSVQPEEVVPLAGAGESPVISVPPPILLIPDDSDGDGVPEGGVTAGRAPVLDGVFTRDPALAAADLALLTASGYEEVLFLRPREGALATVEVATPAGLRGADFPRLPSPGSSALRTAVSTQVCVKPDPTVDSTGADYTAGLPDRVFCDPDARGSFFATFTSGAAVAGGRLWVSTSNAGARQAQPDTQWLPGTLLVFDLDLGADPPRVSPPPPPEPAFLQTSAFNPSDVTRVEVGGRELVLVSMTGPIGIPRDDPGTPAVEGGTLVLGPAAIDVVDPETTRVIGTYPLGPAALAFDGPAVDPTGRVAAVGSEAGRGIEVIDLAPLATLPGDPAVPADLSAYVVFGGDDPLEVPPLPGGAPPVSCPGSTSGVAWNAAGDRLYAVDRCDGTLARFAWSRPAPDAPVLPSSFVLDRFEPLVAPLRADTLGRLRDLGFLRVRPGVPGVDFTGPDLFFTANQPLGNVCSVRIESE